MWDNGDSTLIITPSRKTILIDTGEEDNVITEYLLDRKIKTIDYLLISHYDSDHSGKSIEIIDELNVKNLIISKQSEVSAQFEDTIKAAKTNKVNIIEVQAGNIVKIDKEIQFEILWPQINDTVEENALNNNSIVAKLKYKNFSMLFTGDIEKIAEDKILSQYDKTTLNATVLKIAHHGSKTSSTEEFIKNVEPKISLIGVGKDNQFGHPAQEIIERLKSYGGKIYRTDEGGEITLKVTKKGDVKIYTHIDKTV